MTDVKKTFMEAYLELQKDLAPVGKDAKAYNYKYATLGNVKETVDPILHNHGFVVKQLTEVKDQEIGRSTDLVTSLVHVDSGTELISKWAIKPVKDDPQGMGSALTYGRRYQYMVVCNLVAEDDDGATASSTDKPVEKADQPEKRVYGEDDRPWLTEGQFQSMLKKISEGEAKMVSEKMVGYKMKKVYRETLNKALLVPQEEHNEDVDPDDLPF